MQSIFQNNRFVLIFLFIVYNCTLLKAQNSINILKRDSLDYTTYRSSSTDRSDYFSPITYKLGFLYVSNKKTADNSLGGYNVYWVPKNKLLIHAKDSIQSNYKLNDDFTAPTSNDNNILTHYKKTKEKSSLNVVEKEFSDFNPENSFAISEYSNEVIYPKLSSRKIKGAYRWELWQALLLNGKLKNEKKLNFEDQVADYLYPHLADSGRRLYFSSNKTGGQGGFDIYSINKINNNWVASPISVKEVNTSFNEISPVIENDSTKVILYVSDRIGGLGGYDVYKYNKVDNTSINMGYPLNSEKDEISIASLASKYFVTTLVNQNANITTFEYHPIKVDVKGVLSYAHDSSLAIRQKIYIFNKDNQKIIDSILTDDQANYTFNARPNRNYLLTTINKDGNIEKFDLSTSDITNNEYYKPLALNGRSLKQIQDSLQNLIVIAENRKVDSIKKINTYDNYKFIVYYDFNKFILPSKEKRILDSAVIYLKNNPNNFLIIGAFTDCIGSFKFNYKLSIKRGKAVVAYLLKQGLTKNKIITNAYSKNYNVTPCKIDFKRGKYNMQQRNRRSELIFSKTKLTNWATLEKERGPGFYKKILPKKK